MANPAENIDRAIDLLHVIRFAQSMYGSAPSGHPLIHQAIREAAAATHPKSVARAVVEGLGKHYGLSLSPLA